jgi:hypothetical protein
MTGEAAHILIVDDDRRIRALLASLAMAFALRRLRRQRRRANRCGV